MLARQFVVGVLASALLTAHWAVPASAQIAGADAKCRDGIAKAVGKLAGSVLKEQDKCVQSIMRGTLSGVDCGDLDDPAFPGALKVQKARQKLAKKYSGRRQRLKAVARNKELAMEDRFAATLKLAELPRNSSKTRVRNRCEMTGRPRGFYRKLKMSRIALRAMGNDGKIPGLVKSSW